MLEKKEATPPPQLIRVAIWCAYASGVASIAGILFLLAFFTLGGLFGPLNDIFVMVQYTLMLPIAITLYTLLRPAGPALALAALLLGLAGMLAVIGLQLLLVTGVLPFARQVGPVVVAFLVVLVWFVLNAILGRGRDRLPAGMLLSVLAGLYFGYPFWAFSLARRLRL